MNKFAYWIRLVVSAAILALVVEGVNRLLHQFGHSIPVWLPLGLGMIIVPWIVDAIMKVDVGNENNYYLARRIIHGLLTPAAYALIVHEGHWEFFPTFVAAILTTVLLDLLVLAAVEQPSHVEEALGAS